mmetsp:Transcript_11257/g.20577  ORF Transcript_11257/g.20577 Transcript_11257/m.20577 type:complete len:207 (+) Transcript_11257:937-1557(+)
MQSAWKQSPSILVSEQSSSSRSSVPSRSTLPSMMTSCCAKQPHFNCKAMICEGTCTISSGRLLDLSNEQCCMIGLVRKRRMCRGSLQPFKIPSRAWDRCCASAAKLSSVQRLPVITLIAVCTSFFGTVVLAWMSHRQSCGDWAQASTCSARTGWQLVKTKMGSSLFKAREAPSQSVTLSWSRLRELRASEQMSPCLSTHLAFTSDQ